MTNQNKKHSKMEKENKQNPWRTATLILIIILLAYFAIDIYQQRTNPELRLGKFKIEKDTFNKMINLMQEKDYERIYLTNLEDKSTANIIRRNKK